MQREDMVKLIDAYVKQATSDKKERSYLRKLLLEKEKSFINNWTPGKDYYWAAIRDTVINDPGGKTETLHRMKSFVGFLHRKGIDFDIEWPPIDDIGNRYERILYILRELQTADSRAVTDDEIATKYIAERLWVSKRTIEDDFTYIMPPEDNLAPRTLFQQSLAINGMKRSKGAVQFASTAHPFFLIENLRSVLVLIESLLEKATNPAFQEQAMVTARRIWIQLTPYAQERISILLMETYSEDAMEMQLFNRMKSVIDKENNAFTVEKEEHRKQASYLLDALKFGVSCKVEYKINDWEIAEWTGPVKGSYLQNKKLPGEGDNQDIPFEDIVSVNLLES